MLTIGLYSRLPVIDFPFANLVAQPQPVEISVGLYSEKSVDYKLTAEFRTIHFSFFTHEPVKYMALLDQFDRIIRVKEFDVGVHTTETWDVSYDLHVNYDRPNVISRLWSFLCRQFNY